MGSQIKTEKLKMVRPAYVDSKGMKKGAWSEEEDNKLRAYIQRYGHWNWRLLPNYAGLARYGKSCRLRWENYLKPGIKHGNFSKQEEDLIIQLHNRLGNRWSTIAAELPGRTDNEIKNFWHTNIEKRGKRSVNAIQPESMIKEQINVMTDQVLVPDAEGQPPPPSNPINKTPQILNESNHLDFSNSDVLIPYDSNSQGSVAQTSDILWTKSSDIFWADSNSTTSVAQSSDNFWAELFLDDTSYNQNVYNSFPPLQEDESFKSGLVQEHYDVEYLSSFDYSIPRSFDWNQTNNMLDTSKYPGLASTKYGNFSKQEEDLIIQLHNRLGNGWSTITAELPGRTDNEIKNFWHTDIEKRGKRRPESMIKEQINGMTDQVLVRDGEGQPPHPSNPINKTPQILNESNHLDFSYSDVFIPYDSNSQGSVAQNSDILWTHESSHILWADSNFTASVAQSSDNFWAELFLDDTSYNQNFYNSFPPLQEDESFNSGLVQEPYDGEYLSRFDYTIPTSFDWNPADDMLDTSQSELTYSSSQVEAAGENYDQYCFQYFDHDMMSLF